MKIRIRYENKDTEFEVTEEECLEMIESDYIERKAQAKPGEEVSKRPVQEILDERFNKPEYNSFHKVQRNTVSLENLWVEGGWFRDDSQEPDAVIERRELLHRLPEAIQSLEPQQQELLYRIFFLGEKETEVAKLAGVSRAAISHRMNRIYSQIEKYLKNF